MVLGYLYFLKAAAYLLSMWLIKNNHSWVRFAVCGVLMTVVTIFDFFWFKFYPMEAGIFVAVLERSDQD